MSSEGAPRANEIVSVEPMWGRTLQRAGVDHDGIAVGVLAFVEGAAAGYEHELGLGGAPAAYRITARAASRGTHKAPTIPSMGGRAY
jgi:hypothetical protein